MLSMLLPTQAVNRLHAAATHAFPGLHAAPHMNSNATAATSRHMEPPSHIGSKAATTYAEH
eukprot:8516831-Lingulodinium_polyedra.AAC.1